MQVRLPSVILNIGEPDITSLPAPSDTVANLNPEGGVSIPGIDTNPTDTPEPTPTDVPPTATPALEVVEPTATTEATATPTEEPPTPTPTNTPTPTPIPLPASHELDGLVNIPQSFNNCGPANMSIVLSYHNDDTSQDEAATFLKPNPNDRNVSPWQITDYVNENTTLNSAVFSGGTAEMLKRLIVAGLPPVVERGIDFNDGNGWYGHYLTLFGYDDETEMFNAMNTYARPWEPNGGFFTYDDVLSSWQDFNYTFYVIYPDHLEATMNEIVGETLLDRETMWHNAVAIAQMEISENPQDKFAWFNLGTSLTELGSLTGEQVFYEQGAEAFDTARTLELPYRMLWYQHRPYMAYYKISRFEDVIQLADVTLSTRGGENVEETYLWKGHALASTGDAGGARDAYTEALAKNSNFYPAQWALDYLNRD